MKKKSKCMHIEIHCRCNDNVPNDTMQHKIHSTQHTDFHVAVRNPSQEVIHKLNELRRLSPENETSSCALWFINFSI